jgi:hypothetical protein
MDSKHQGLQLGHSLAHKYGTRILGGAALGQRLERLARRRDVISL